MSDFFGNFRFMLLRQFKKNGSMFCIQFLDELGLCVIDYVLVIFYIVDF